jgi:hypothetical protein
MALTTLAQSVSAPDAFSKMVQILQCELGKEFVVWCPNSLLYLISLDPEVKMVCGNAVHKQLEPC